MRSTLGLAAVIVLACKSQSAAPVPTTTNVHASAQERDTIVATNATAPLRPLNVVLADGADGSGKFSPVSLTASDGTGLRLVSLAVNAAIDNPLALTELHFVFENPQARIIEGNFKIQLPEGASLSRFAMKNENGWQEGEVVEKQAARRAYEDFLHRKQDPALMEQAPGNEFAARVFPIPAGGKKEVIVTYAQTLTKASPYLLPLKGLPKLGSLSVKIAAQDKRIVDITKTGAVPGSDIRIQTDELASSQGLQADGMAIVRVVPLRDSAPDTLASTVFLFDTSASRMLGLREQTALLAALVEKLPQGTPVAVLAFDQTVEPMFNGVREDWKQEHVDKLLARGAMGASNLSAALEGLAAFEKTSGAKHKRVVLLGDGVATAGETDAQKLRGKLESAREAFERIDAVVIGGIRDEAALRGIVRSSLKNPGVVLDASIGSVEIARRLNLKTSSKIPVQVEGASWVYPTFIDGVQAGDDVLVYVRGAAKAIRVGESKPAGLELRKTHQALLERALAVAQIASLTESPPEGDATKAKPEIIALSTKYRVISNQTAMLVLETDADYKRFNIDRTAKVDILAIEDNRIALTSTARLGAAESEKHKSRAKVAPAEEVERGVPPVGDGHDANPELALGGGQGAAPALGGPMPPSAPKSDDVEAAKPIAAPGGGSGAMPSAERYEQRSAQARAAAPAATIGAVESAREGRLERYTAADGTVRFRRVPNGAPLAADTPSGNGPNSDANEWKRRLTNPYSGRYLTVMNALARGKKDDAAREAAAWRSAEPSNVMAFLAQGEVSEAEGNRDAAARAYGSILELFSFRADSRRFAGERLERLGTPLAYQLAADAYRGATEQRPDHPASHRLLAFALLRAGKFEAAFIALENGIKQRYPSGRFAGVDMILREDLGLVAEAWIGKQPDMKEEILARLKKAGGVREGAASLRFVLNWETDANDVDFHIQDGKGNEAFYSNPELPTGGKLYADVTTGYGPECFTIRYGARAFPYKLSAHYYSRGPMGYGMGTLQIIQHDGKGGLVFEERPFVIMQDDAFVDLGSVNAPLKNKSE
jgi:tetratricopeptide (TPR) repeat protein